MGLSYSCAEFPEAAAQTGVARRYPAIDVARGMKDRPAADPTVRFELAPTIKHATGHVKGPAGILSAT
jgi:hypothetical protein